MSDKAVERQHSTTVARAAALLQLLADNPEGMGITALTTQLDTQRAPLYRILESLIRFRLVRKDVHKRYLLGVGTVQLARAYSSQFPSSTEQILAELANHVEITATLISAERDVLTTVVSVTPSTNREHVFTPPGFRHPEGPLATRIALHASLPPTDDDSEEVIEARARGYAIARGAITPVRYAAAAVVPGSESSGSTLIVAVVSLNDFDMDAVGEPLIHAAHALALPYTGISRV